MNSRSSLVCARIAFFVVGLLAFILRADAAGVSLPPRSEFDAFAARVTSQLPSGWHVAERAFGPQQITMHWRAYPVGLRLRLDGPQIQPPMPYIGPLMTPAQMRAYRRPRPEAIYLWIMPRSYKPQKDSFLIDWFRPDDQQTHRLGSTAAFDLYAYGGFCYSWAHWRSDIKGNLRK